MRGLFWQRTSSAPDNFSFHIQHNFELGQPLPNIHFDNQNSSVGRSSFIHLKGSNIDQRKSYTKKFDKERDTHFVDHKTVNTRKTIVDCETVVDR